MAEFTQQNPMPILRIIIVPFLVFATSVSVFAYDEAFSFFVEACRRSGYNPTEIVTFQAELTLEIKMHITDSVVEDIVQSQAEKLQAALKTDESTRQISMDEVTALIMQSFSNEIAPDRLKVFVRNSATTLGLTDAPTQILEEDLNKKISSLFIIGSEKQTVLSLLEHSLTIQTNRDTERYYLGGRFRSKTVVPSLKLLLSSDNKGSFSISHTGIDALKMDCETSGRTFHLSKAKIEYEVGHFADIFDIHENGQLSERFWIDSDRGYICPKEQSFNPIDGTVISEVISENFILDEHSQKWFPMKVVRISWIGVKPGDTPMNRAETRIIPGTLILNQPIPDSVFALTVQQGTQVADMRREDNDKITFIANQTGKLDLPTVEQQNLDDIPWLTSRGVRLPHEPPPIEKASLGWTQIVLLAAGVILIILGLLLRFFGK